MKKRGMALQNIIIALLTIIVVVIGSRMFIDLSSEPVKYLLGIGNASAFDDAIVQRFNDTKHMNQDAILSTTAFLYSVNRLVQSDKNMLDMNWPDAGRSFGSVKVIPTDHNLRPLYLGAGAQDPGEQLARALIDCWTIFADEANENKYCFILDTTALESSVEESDLISGLEGLRADTLACGAACQSKITDLLGDSWAPWDVENIYWGSGVITRGTEDIIVCADNTRLNEAHITSRFSGHCEIVEPEGTLGNQIYMEGFSLPQEISKSSNPVIYAFDEVLNAYGDPAYMLFYEKFPAAEAKWWESTALGLIWSEFIIGGQNIIHWSIDLVTGIGELFSWGLGTQDISPEEQREAGERLEHALVNPEWAVRKELLLKDLGENILEFIKEHKEELPEQDSIRLTRDAGTATVNMVNDLSDELGERFLTRTGKITFQGQEILIERINKDIIQEKFNEATTEKLVEKIKETIEESNTRRIPRPMLTAYNIRKRAQNILKKSLSQELNEGKSKEAIKAMITESSEGLNALKPRDLTVVAKGVNEIMPSIITDDGEIIFGEILDAKPDRESQKAARTIMAQRLDRIIDSEGEALFQQVSVFRTVHERLTRNSIKAGSDKVKARNLIAGTAVYYAMKIESLAGKSKPTGANAVGLRAPFIGTAVYDDQIVEFLGRENLMENFGKDEVHIGLLPEAGEYYISLTRDQHAYWFDQPPIRFHLVSPCYAELMMRVTRCDCGYHPDPDAGLYQTGVAYPQLQEAYPEYYPNGILPHFDGTNAMLFRIDENGRPVKDCTPSAWHQFDNLYKPKCIQVNPVLVEDHPGEYNYCYHGNDPLNQVLWDVVTLAEMALPFSCLLLGKTVVLAPLIPKCMAVLAVATVPIGEPIKDAMGVSKKWPNRGTW